MSTKKIKIDEHDQLSDQPSSQKRMKLERKDNYKNNK